jgi:hypothetical protein
MGGAVAFELWQDTLESPNRKHAAPAAKRRSMLIGTARRVAISAWKKPASVMPKAARDTCKAGTLATSLITKTCLVSEFTTAERRLGFRGMKCSTYITPAEQFQFANHES